MRHLDGVTMLGYDRIEQRSSLGTADPPSGVERSSRRRPNLPLVLTHTRDELQADYLRLIGRTGDEPGTLTIDDYSEDLIVARTSFVGAGLRPEGMIAGPSLFMVVDTMGYLVTISRAPRGSNGFTTAVAMQFLRSAPMGSLRIEGRLLRYSKRSSVVDTLVFSESVDEPVAQAVVTYVPVLASD